MTGASGRDTGRVHPVPYLPPLRHPRRRIGRRQFDFSAEIVVMGIVNRTPDSFFDRGRTYALDRAVRAALDAAAAGAGWIDVGGMPFSPDTPEVSTAEELDRVLPVVAAVAAASDIVISVDTFRSEVAAAAIAAGASVVNDTTGLHHPELADVVAGTGATVVVTHSRAQPRQHLPRPRYEDVVADVKAFLAARVQRALDHGVPEERIVIDPGHDLNKNTLHTLELTRRLSEIADLGLPLLAAVSNKDFVGESTGLAKPDRGAASVAAATACALAGARLWRMHDVAAAVGAARLVEAVLGLRQPSGLRHNMG